MENLAKYGDIKLGPLLRCRRYRHWREPNSSSEQPEGFASRKSSSGQYVIASWFGQSGKAARLSVGLCDTEFPLVTKAAGFHVWSRSSIVVTVSGSAPSRQLFWRLRNACSRRRIFTSYTASDMHVVRNQACTVATKADKQAL
ncbi:hypothetical protein MY10362_003554 [Beauveria mimosiformis]